MNTSTTLLQANSKPGIKTLGRVSIVTLLLMFVSACASMPVNENPVESRAQARWDALLARDYAAAYQYYSPGYRSSHSPVDFEIDLRSRKVMWTSADVLKSSCDANVCTVDSEVEYKVSRPVPGINEWDNKKTLPEKWVRIDGQWWYSPDK